MAFIWGTTLLGGHLHLGTDCREVPFTWSVDTLVIVFDFWRYSLYKMTARFFRSSDYSKMSQLCLAWKPLFRSLVWSSETWIRLRISRSSALHWNPLFHPRLFSALPPSEGSRVVNVAYWAVRSQFLNLRSEPFRYSKLEQDSVDKAHENHILLAAVDLKDISRF